MAKKVITTIEDDVDGSDAVETIKFSIDGTQFEIDLSGKNAARLRKDIGDWAQHGRRVSGKKPAGKRRDHAPSSNAESQRETQRIRKWAAANGKPVAPRGRVPDSIKEEYYAAH